MVYRSKRPFFNFNFIILVQIHGRDLFAYIFTYSTNYNREKIGELVKGIILYTRILQ